MPAPLSFCQRPRPKPPLPGLFVLRITGSTAKEITDVNLKTSYEIKPNTVNEIILTFSNTINIGRVTDVAGQISIPACILLL